MTFAAAAAEVGLSAATLVQRFGTKRKLLLAADKRGIDLWVSALDRSTAASPLTRVVDGLVFAVDPVATPEQMANSVATLQLDSPIPTSTPRRSVEREPSAPASCVIWTPGSQRANCAPAPTSRNSRNHLPRRNDRLGIHRESTLEDWMRDQLEAVLAPHRTAS